MDALVLFEAEGARRVEPGILQPAGTLLDLYGEDIRARAYVTHDPVLGELMLRPDFTVPVANAHEGGAASYCYDGPVFRMHAPGSQRPVETRQIGIELLGHEDRAEADARTFALIARIVEGRGLSPVTGDMGVLADAVACLTTNEARKAALRRHLWRPTRFRRLLSRFSHPVEYERERTLTLERIAHHGPQGQQIGLRAPEDIADRARILLHESRETPIASEQAELIEGLLSLKTTLAGAVAALREASAILPGLADASERIAARIDALARHGITTDLPFEVAYGRTALEYYDGFVFGFLAEQGGPAIASGGRYDALMAALGKPMPAIGAILRPAMLETP